MTLQLSVGSRLPSISWRGVTQEQVLEYLSVAGDDNRLHIDREIAATLGLARPPVPGMLLLAQLERSLRSWPQCEEIRRIEVRFVSPVFAEQGVTLDARVVALDHEREQAVLRLVLLVEQRPVILGEATVLVRRA